MGLLSSRTFRQIATGALTGIEERRKEMEDRIDVYRERAVNKKAEIQKKYNEFYDEEKENIDTFNQLSTLVGDDYVGKLNSFAQASPARLSMLLNQNADVVRAELDKYQDSDADFVTQRKEKLKLKESELNQNLQDQVGLFKGTSTLFTRDIERRGLKDIQTEVGTLETETLPSIQAAGPGIDVKTKLNDTEKFNAINNFDKLYKTVDTGDGFDYQMSDKDPDKYANPYVQSVFDKVAIMEANAAEQNIILDTQTALAEVLYQNNNPTYKGDNLKFITPVGPKDPRLNTAEFESALNEGNIEEMKKIQQQNKSLNIFIAEDMLNDIRELEGQLESGEETTTTTTVDLTEDVTARPPDPAPYQRGRPEGDAIVMEQQEWDKNYGNTHFDDGTLMSPTQQEAWKKSQAEADKFGRPKRPKKNIQLYVK
tara:strand:- start:2907 stop:4184 length:1278 start_codon:yes stop_codon:yes gene_type:complete